MSNYDYATDMAEQNTLNKKRNKKKLNELLDKYGESREAIEQNADLKDSFDYMFAHGDSLIDEVLEERQMKRAQSSFPQTPYPTIAKNNSNHVAPSNLPEMEEENRNITDRKIREKMDILLDRARNTINNFEGTIRYFYLDTKGNITTANGANVDNFDVFMGLDSLKDNRHASISEKKSTYDFWQEQKRKKQYGYSYPAKYYENLSALRISDKTANELMNNHLKHDIRSLQKTFPKFNNYPLPLQEVLLDIHYNTGNVSSSNWPNLHRGIRTKDLSLIADNVHRKDVQPKRNSWALEKIKSIVSW